MSDVQLRKKVQLKQKHETPMVMLKTKKSDDSAILGTAATAAAATAAAAKAASNATFVGTTSASAVAGAEVNPVSGSANVAKGATDAGKTGDIGNSKKISTAGTSGSGDVEKKGGKVLAWIFVIAVFAGLVFGIYKLAINNRNSEKPTLLAENNTEVLEGRNESAAETNNVLGFSSGEAYDVDNTSIQNSDASGSDESANGTIAGEAGGESPVLETTSEEHNSNGNTIADNDSSSLSMDRTDESQNVLNSACIKSISENQAVCFFAFDSSVIGESDVLDNLASIAKSSGKEVIINAYADEVGTDEYNYALSQKRANTVKNYFISKGVDAVVITALGNGETTLYSTMAENRRADIIIE